MVKDKLKDLITLDKFRIIQLFEIFQFSILYIIYYIKIYQIVVLF